MTSLVKRIIDLTRETLDNEISFIDRETLNVISFIYNPNIEYIAEYLVAELTCDLDSLPKRLIDSYHRLMSNEACGYYDHNPSMLLQIETTHSIANQVIKQYFDHKLVMYDIQTMDNWFDHMTHQCVASYKSQYQTRRLITQFAKTGLFTAIMKFMNTSPPIHVLKGEMLREHIRKMVHQGLSASLNDGYHKQLSERIKRWLFLYKIVNQ